MNNQSIQSSASSILPIPPLYNKQIHQAGSATIPASINGQIHPTTIHSFSNLNNSNYGGNVTPTIFHGYTSIPSAASNYSTNSNNNNSNNNLINDSSNNYNNHSIQKAPGCKYPGFVQMGDGQTKVLMGYMVKSLKPSDLEFFRTIMDKFDIVEPHILEFTVKTYRDFSNKAEAIQLPPQQIKKSKTDGNDSNILYHTKKGNVPDGIINQQQKETTDNKINKTAIKNSGVKKPLYLNILKLMVDMKSLCSKTVDKSQDIVLKIQNNLYYNTIITLGTQYDIETDTGKRYASLKKQIDQTTGLYKKLKKVETMDDEVYKYWTQYTTDWNDKQREKCNDNKISKIGDDDVDNNDIPI